jgi:hypothetical protein
MRRMTSIMEMVIKIMMNKPSLCLGGVGGDDGVDFPLITIIEH